VKVKEEEEEERNGMGGGGKLVGKGRSRERVRETTNVYGGQFLEISNLEFFIMTYMHVI